MRKIHIAGASTLALGVALASGNAGAVPPTAPRVLTTNIADYNAAQVATAKAILTVPAGLATYQVNKGSLEINSRFTVTLPPNFAFSSQPSLTDTGSSTFTLFAGGIGTQSATFVVGAAPLIVGQSVTLNSFAISGATVLETPIPVATALPITVQSTNNAEIDNNDPSPLSAGAFASEPGAELGWGPGFAFIDLGSPSLGTSFEGYDLEFGGSFFGPTDTPTIGIMSIEIEPQTRDLATPGVAVLSPSGGPNTLSTSDTATLTVPGFFNGISAAFTSSTPDCQTPVATGSATPTQITIPGVPFGVTQAVCITANGTTLLQPDLQGFSVAMTPGTSTDFLASSGVNLDEDQFPGIVSYIGGGIISVTNFFTGDDSGYSSLLRVNNAGTGPATLYALVQPDTGGVALTGLLGTLAAGAGTVFSEPQVQAVVPGLSLANSGQRSTLQLIVAGTVSLSEANAAPHRTFAQPHMPASLHTSPRAASIVHPKVEPFFGNAAEVLATGLLVNPSGVVTEMPGSTGLQIPDL